jgi:MFS family permease
VEIDETRPRGGRVFASLSSRNYRLFFWGQLISICGTWMQWVAQSFLVLQLTNSGTELGLATAARFVPIFLFGPWGGVIADRLDKRRVLYWTQSLSGLLALAFGILVGTHVITMLTVYLLALALGFVNVFDVPARQSFISELVPRELLGNAVTLNSVTVNVARVLGAAAGGGIASVLGLALCFDVNAASFVAVVITLLLMRQREMLPAKREEREPHQVRAGLAYVRGEPELLVPLLMVAIVGGLAWEFPVSLPLMAQHVFHGGAGTYGAMTAAMGAGAAIGGLITASRGRVRRSGLAVSAIGWGLAITAAALAPGLATEFAVLLFVGYGSVTFNSLAKTVLQLSAAPSMRGRVMALWAVAWQGSTPVGGPIVGWAGQALGARWSLLVGGVPTFVVGVLAYRILHRIDQRRSEVREGVAVGAEAAAGLDPNLDSGEVRAPPANPDRGREASDSG